jgi:phosphate/sulfate permease
LSLIGFLPTYYALDMNRPSAPREVHDAAIAIRKTLEHEGAITSEIQSDLDAITSELDGKTRFAQVRPETRWQVRQWIFRFRRNLDHAHLPRSTLEAIAAARKPFSESIEYVPTWVVIGVAITLGLGTMIGYKRIVVTVAEKIGKTHLTYGQGAAAEVIAALTIGLADAVQLPVSTTHVLSSGIAGTMWANRSGLQGETVKKIGLAWVLTLPAAVLLSGVLFTAGNFLVTQGPSPKEVAVTSANRLTSNPVPAGPAGSAWRTVR